MDGQNSNYNYDEAVDRIAEKYGVPKVVYQRMLGQESGDNDTAVSPVGAFTAWQIMPGTARGLGYDPQELKDEPLKAAEGGLRILRDNYKQFREYAENEKHAWMMSVAGYHTNPKNVLKDIKRGGYGLPNTSDGLITTKNHVLKIFDGLTSELFDRSPLGLLQSNPQSKTTLNSSKNSGLSVNPEDLPKVSLFDLEKQSLDNKLPENNIGNNIPPVPTLQLNPLESSEFLPNNEGLDLFPSSKRVPDLQQSNNPMILEPVKGISKPVQSMSDFSLKTGNGLVDPTLNQFEEIPIDRQPATYSVDQTVSDLPNTVNIDTSPVLEGQNEVIGKDVDQNLQKEYKTYSDFVKSQKQTSMSFEKFKAISETTPDLKATASAEVQQPTQSVNTTEPTKTVNPLQNPTNYAPVSNENLDREIIGTQKFSKIYKTKPNAETVVNDVLRQIYGVGDESEAEKVYKSITGEELIQPANLEAIQGDIDRFWNPKTGEYTFESEPVYKKARDVIEAYNRGGESAVRELVQKPISAEAGISSKPRLTMTDDELKAQAKANISGDPFSTGTDADIEAEYQRLKDIQLSEDDAQFYAEKGRLLKENPELYGTSSSPDTSIGLYKFLGGVADTIAGAARPFASLGLIEKDAYTEMSKLGQGARIFANAAKHNDWLGDAGEFVGQTTFEVPKYVAMSALPGGAIVAFGLDSGLQTSGRGETVENVGKEAVKGALLGGIFTGAGKLSKIAEKGVLNRILSPNDAKAVEQGMLNIKFSEPVGRAVLTAKVFGEGVRIGSIGSGTMSLELASGEDVETALKRAAVITLSDLVMQGRRYGEIKDLAGKIFRVSKNGRTADVTVDPNGSVKLLKGNVPKETVDAEFNADKVIDVEIGKDGVYKAKNDTSPVREKEFRINEAKEISRQNPLLETKPIELPESSVKNESLSKLKPTPEQTAKLERFTTKLGDKGGKVLGAKLNSEGNIHVEWKKENDKSNREATIFTGGEMEGRFSGQKDYIRDLLKPETINQPENNAVKVSGLSEGAEKINTSKNATSAYLENQPIERALERFSNPETKSERMIVPEVLELTAKEKKIVEDNPGILAPYKFTGKRIGNDLLAVTAKPEGLKGSEVKEVVKHLLNTKVSADFAPPMNSNSVEIEATRQTLSLPAQPKTSTTRKSLNVEKLSALDKSRAAKIDAEYDKVSGLSGAQLIDYAKIEFKNGILYTNGEATELLRQADYLAFSDADGANYYGRYLNPKNAERIEKALKLSFVGVRFNQASRNQKIKDLIAEVEKARGASDLKDIRQVVTAKGVPYGLRAARQEETAHGKDYAVGFGHRVSSNIFKDDKIGRRAIRHLNRTAYNGASKEVLGREVGAKIWTDTATKDLNISEDEVNYLRDLYTDSILKNGRSSKDAEKAFRPVSRSARNYLEKKGQKEYGKSGNGKGTVERSDISGITGTRRASDTGGEGKISGTSETKRTNKSKQRKSTGKSNLKELPLFEQKFIERNSKGDDDLSEAVAGEVLHSKGALAKKMTAGDFIIDLTNMPKALNASIDLSAGGRQGLIAAIPHPIIATKSFWKQIRALVSSKYHKNFIENLENHPFRKMAEETGLYLSSLTDGSVNAREEQFMSRLLGDDKFFENAKAEITRKGLSFPVRASERAYSTFLDDLRINVFAELAKQVHAYNERNGITKDEFGKDEYNKMFQKQIEGVSKFVNYATGRGSLGRFEDAGEFLNIPFFSARYWASRFQVMNPAFYKNLPPGARGAVMKDFGIFLGAMVSVFALLKLAGFDIETDPDNPDFLKLRIGQYSYDLTGGMVQQVRYAAQTTASVATGDFEKAAKNTGRYIRTKLSPVFSSAVNLGTGENLIGEPVTASGEALGLISPISVEQVYEGAEKDGLLGVLQSSPDILGFSTTRYSNSLEVGEMLADAERRLVSAKTPEEEKRIQKEVDAWRSVYYKTKKQPGELPGNFKQIGDEFEEAKESVVELEGAETEEKKPPITLKQMLGFYHDKKDTLFSFAKDDLESLIIQKAELLNVRGKLNEDDLKEIRKIIPEYEPITPIHPGVNKKPEKLKKIPLPKLNKDFPKPPKPFNVP